MLSKCHAPVVHPYLRVFPNIISSMARGWESKSVESQQEDAAQKSGKSRVKLSPQAAAHNRELENLKLARQRVVQQIKDARSPRHREQLESTLADLDQRLSRFSAQAPARDGSPDPPTSG